MTTGHPPTVSPGRAERTKIISPGPIGRPQPQQCSLPGAVTTGLSVMLLLVVMSHLSAVTVEVAGSYALCAVLFQVPGASGEGIY
jgi:hypothetical protein